MGDADSMTPTPVPNESGCRVVAFFHTHPGPPLDHPQSDGYQNDTPSDADKLFAASKQIPGIIRYGTGSTSDDTTDITFGYRPAQEGEDVDETLGESDLVAIEEAENLAWDCASDPQDPPACNGDCGGGSTHGDPHIISIDGLGNSFQAVGEFVLAESSDGDFTIQVRQQPRLSSRTVSVNDAMAINIMGDRFAIYPVRDATPFRYDTYINGVLTPLEDPVTTLPNGGRIFKQGGDLLLVWPDTSQIVLHPNTSSANLPRINAEVQIAPTRRGTLQGLWGNFDGQSANDLTTRDGTILPTRPTFEEFYRVWGESWRVTNDTSLFDYFDGEDTEFYTDRTFPDEPVSRSSLPADARERAEQICTEAGITDSFLFETCVIDVAMMDDPSFADDAMTTAEASSFEPPDTVVEVLPSPKIIINSPEAGSTVSSNVFVQGTVGSEQAIVSLIYSLNDNPERDTTNFLTGDAFAFTIPGGEFLTGSNSIRIVAENNEGTQGSSTITVNYDPDAAPAAGGDLVVFNDINLFDDNTVDETDNARLVKNLVSFPATGGQRDDATTVAFDRGRNSVCGVSAGNAECGDGNLSIMRSLIEGEGYSLVELDSSSGTLINIAADIRTLFLWLPLVDYTVSEINALKQFAAQGGRIIFVGEREPFYDGFGRGGFAVQNQFLLDMGAELTNIGGDIDCSPTVIPSESVRASQITDGVTSMTVNCASAVNLGPNDYAIFYDSSNSTVLAGVAAIDVNPITESSVPEHINPQDTRNTAPASSSYE